MTPRDLANIDVTAAFFDANPPDLDLDEPVLRIPDEVYERYSPENMRVEGPFDDGSFLVGVRLVPRDVGQGTQGYVWYSGEHSGDQRVQRIVGAHDLDNVDGSPS